MTINERFEAIIQVLFAGNKRAFALHVGISPTVVENVVGTRKGIGENAKALKGINKLFVEK